MSSTHKVEVFQIEEVFPHPNADALEIIRPWGYQCIVKKGEWERGDLAAYVPPDSLVPLDSEVFSWLRDTKRTPKMVDGKEYHRVTAVKLRKAPSLGLVIPVSGESKPGDDLAEALGVLHYDPPSKERGPSQPGRRPFWMEKFKPNVSAPRYDLEALRRYNHVFQPGEPVWVTEKIHGANWRGLWDNSKKFTFTQQGLRLGPIGVSWNQKGPRVSWIPASERHLWVGSRNLWLLKKATDDWWKVIDKYPQIVDLLRDVPGCVLYGEVYGDVQDLRYGMSNGEVDFAAFDLRSESGPFYHYENFLYAMFAYKIPVVPLLTTAPIPYDPDQILEMAEGKTLIEGANHIREGVVVRPLMERLDPTVGRVVLKVVSTAYLETQK